MKIFRPRRLIIFAQKNFFFVLITLLGLNLVLGFLAFAPHQEYVRFFKQTSKPELNLIKKNIKNLVDSNDFRLKSNPKNEDLSNKKSQSIIEKNNYISLNNHRIKVEYEFADPSNFGDRVQINSSGKILDNKPLFVLHETVISADEAVKKFKTFNAKDQDQSSYHVLIRKDGTLVWIVPFDYRAFGAGDSEFLGESIQTNLKIKPSVNNFAYHIGLETPSDGNNENANHSGYTRPQYESLSLILSYYIHMGQLLPSRITTHKEIDRSKTRTDPRSFEMLKVDGLINKFLKEYKTNSTNF